MRVLQINVVYASGSTGRIVATLHRGLLDEGVDSYVCYGREQAKHEINVKKIAPEVINKLQSLNAKVSGYAYAGCFFGTKALLRQIEQIKPDIVHLQCINGYFVNIYSLLNYLKERKIETVLTLHAEFMYTANCGHAFECEGWKNGCGLCDRSNPERPVSWFFDRGKEQWKKMQKAFEGFEHLHVVAVSDWLKSRAEMSPFFEGKDISVIYNGVDTSVFKPTDEDNVKEKYGLQGKRIWLYLTPDFLFPLKGGSYIIELAKKVKQADVRIVMVGRNLPDAVPDNVVKIPYIESQKELAALYTAADITLLTSKRETFSMVCVESLCCGTPVVGYRAGGPESIAIAEYSCFVPYGDMDALLTGIQKLLDKELDKRTVACNAREKYSMQTMVNQYLGMYRQLVEK